MALKVNWPPTSWEITLFDLFGMLYHDIVYKLDAMKMQCNTNFHFRNENKANSLQISRKLLQ